MYVKRSDKICRINVLIVAKCIVNKDTQTVDDIINEVLIVAKCIVNLLSELVGYLSSSY